MLASKLVLPKEGKVTRSSILEYAEALRSRYIQASRVEKGKVTRRHDEQGIGATMEARLCQISPTTIDRLLKPHRQIGE
jgi:hypothetical protein